MRLKALRKSGFHFAERQMRKTNHSGPGDRQLHLGAMAQESGESDHAIFQRRLFEQTAQTRRDAARDVSIIIAPEIDPRFGLADDLIDQLFADGKAGVAKAFFADWIGG